MLLRRDEMNAEGQERLDELALRYRDQLAFVHEVDAAVQLGFSWPASDIDCLSFAWLRVLREERDKLEADKLENDRRESERKAAMSRSRRR